MGVDIAWPPTFSLVCATPLLQHQTQLGLNPALITVAKTVGVAGHRCEQLGGVVTQPRHDRPVRTRDLLIASPASRHATTRVGAACDFNADGCAGVCCPCMSARVDRTRVAIKTE